jgi:hypothetical protein
LRLKKILQIVVLHMENGKLDKVCDAISAA